MTKKEKKRGLRPYKSHDKSIS